MPHIPTHEFALRMYQVYADCKGTGYQPNRYLNMLNYEGPLTTAHRLLAQDGEANGSDHLVRIGRADLTVEAVVLEFPRLFSDEELEIAEMRLTRARGAA